MGLVKRGILLVNLTRGEREVWRNLTAYDSFVTFTMVFNEN